MTETADRVTRAVPGFDPIPSWRPADRVAVEVTDTTPTDATVIGVPAFSDGDVAGSGPARPRHARGVRVRGGARPVARPPRVDGPTVIEIGVGRARGRWTRPPFRDAAAAFARAAVRHGRLVVDLTGLERRSIRPRPGRPSSRASCWRAIATDVFRDLPNEAPLEALTIVAPTRRTSTPSARAPERGEIAARATTLARDLGNTPGHPPDGGADGRGRRGDRRRRPASRSRSSTRRP